MAKVIEIYTPNSFKSTKKWVSPEDRGKIIAFPSPKAPIPISKPGA